MWIETGVAMAVAEQPNGPTGEAHDPEVAEDYAESVGVDPTNAEVKEYLQIAGDPVEPDESDRP
jgi:hypothetical protein